MDALLTRTTDHDDLSRRRLQWLIQVRWAAVAGIVLAALFFAAMVESFPGIAWKPLLALGAVSGVYNLALYLWHRTGRVLPNQGNALLQAWGDIGILTLFLWCVGGLEAPFVTLYLIHIAMVGILGGPRASARAVLASAICVALLALTHLVPALTISTWAPSRPWFLFMRSGAFLAAATGVAYVATHAALELKERERAIAVLNEKSQLEYHLLTQTLNQIEAGLEVRDHKGALLWQNRIANTLSANVRDGLETGRFQATVDGRERTYEMHSFPLSSGADPAHPRAMNLYLDRTQAIVDEKRLMSTERLVNLGRVAQGVAHELNTPLATIRTLASDMVSVLTKLEDPTSEDESTVPSQLRRDFADMRESADLIHDETRRLARITRSLLAGGALDELAMRDDVLLLPIVKRARALVLAGPTRTDLVYLDRSLDQVTARVDADRLLQICVNLIQNAADAIQNQKDGQIHVSANARNPLINLVIRDNGPGISDTIKEKVFEPFVTTKSAGEGTGLGLYTASMLAEAMGGTLTIESPSDGGTVATISLVPSL